MTDIVSKFVGQKVSKVRWLPSAGSASHKALVLGAWDDKINNVSLWQVEADQKVRGPFEKPPELTEPNKIWSCQVHGDVTDIKDFGSKRFLASSSTGDVHFFAADLTQPTLEKLWSWENVHQHTASDSAPCTAIACDRETVVSVGEDSSINLLSFNEPKPTRTIYGTDGITINDVAFQVSSTLVTVNASAEMQLWDIRDKSNKPSLTMRTDPLAGDEGIQSLQAVAVHPSQPNTVATGGSDGVLSVWDIKQPRFPVAITQAHSAELWEIKFHPRFQDHMFTCSEDGQLLHWDTNPSRLDSRTGFSIAPEGDNLSITNLIGSTTSLGVNSIDSEAELLACGTDNEALVLFGNLKIR
eukprot:m.82084 g.82084  ORF g.82084 m.82084 type:complete len:355 (+) comp21027_c0_seq1:78-1142(+)